VKKASPAESPRALSLWLWVAAGVLFMAVLWTAMFRAAGRTAIESVPLAAKGGRP